MRRIQIERKSKVLPADITREHLRGVGKPVIITDATENWPARSKWTFEFLQNRLRVGSRHCVARDRRWSWKADDLSAYINFLDAPLAELPGVWTGKRRSPNQPRREGGLAVLLDWLVCVPAASRAL